MGRDFPWPGFSAWPCLLPWCPWKTWKTPITPRGAPSSAASPGLLLPHPRLRPVKEMSQTHEYLSIEYSEEEVWLTWTDKNNDHHEKSIRQLAQEARAGNAHDENVLSYYR